MQRPRIIATSARRSGINEEKSSISVLQIGFQKDGLTQRIPKLGRQGLLYQRCITRTLHDRTPVTQPLQVTEIFEGKLERAMGIEPTTFSLGS